MGKLKQQRARAARSREGVKKRGGVIGSVALYDRPGTYTTYCIALYQRDHLTNQDLPTTSITRFTGPQSGRALTHNKKGMKDPQKERVFPDLGGCY